MTMAQTEQYVKMMLDSLQKKDKVLEEIIRLNKVQTEIASKEELDIDEFSHCVEEKQKYIDELNSLDDGFQMLFDKVKDELNKSKELYKDEIRQMQGYIKMLSEKSILIKAQEEKNRLSLQSHFSRMKDKVKVAKQSIKAATDYYKSMSKTNIIDSQFMDKKK